jgi:uncharacterized protein (TIGR03067 family)
MRRILALLALLVMGFAPAPFPKPERTGRDKLVAMRGEWKLVSLSLDGRPLRAAGGMSAAVFDGNRLSLLDVDGVVISRWIVTLAPSKNPKRMDLKDADAPDQTLLGIYKLDGDTLTLACANPTIVSKGPTDFNPHKGTEVSVYKRKKK